MWPGLNFSILSPQKSAFSESLAEAKIAVGSLKMSGKVSDLVWMQPNTTLGSTALLFINFLYVKWQNFKRQTIVKLHWLEYVCFVSARPSGQSPCPRSSLALSTFTATGEGAKIFKCCHENLFRQRSWLLLGDGGTFMRSFWSHSCVPLALELLSFPQNKFSPKLQFARRLQDLVAFSCICFTLCSHPWQGQLRRSIPAD